jgi:hypothetical protein
MRLEGDHGHRITGRGSLTCGGHQRLVSTVDAIKITNGRHSPSLREATGSVSTQDPHSRHHSILVKHGIIRVAGPKA